MKKLLILSVLLMVLIFPSCSSDSSEARQSSVTAKIDGVNKIFNTVNVDTETYTEDDITWTDVIVTASINNSPTERISFIVERGLLGLDASWYFAYFLDETFHPKMDTFQTSVTENTNNTLKGTFAGQVQASDTNVVVDVESGTFNISY